MVFWKHSKEIKLKRCDTQPKAEVQELREQNIPKAKCYKSNGIDNGLKKPSSLVAITIARDIKVSGL